MTKKKRKEDSRRDWGAGYPLPGNTLILTEPGTWIEDPAHEVHKLRAALAEAYELARIILDVPDDEWKLMEAVDEIRARARALLAQNAEKREGK